MGGLANGARKFVRPLRGTPLHPQWLAFRKSASLREWIRASARGQVLDIGCADGHVREWLERCEYIGLDYPTTALAMYGTRPDIFADAAALPVADECIDTVLLLEVLEHVSDPGSVMAEIARVLRPGGSLLLSMPFLYPMHDAPHDFRRYTSHGLVAAIRGVGLECEPVVPRNAGFEAVALLSSIACAEAVVESWRRRSWLLLLAPVLVISIPVLNMLGWVGRSLFGGGTMMAAGHSVLARKPS